MVALEADDLSRRGQIFQPDDIIHHLLGLGAPVDIVPHEQQPVSGEIGVDLVHEAFQGFQAPVDIADGVKVTVHLSPYRVRRGGPACPPSWAHTRCAPTMPFHLQPAEELFPPVQPGEARLPGHLLSLFVLQGREELAQGRVLPGPAAGTILAHDIDVGIGRNFLGQKLHDSPGAGQTVGQH